uniref:Sodium-coupled neutral amino acid transporter 10 isoform X2 n=1 Tax=Crassostrea virginica TaxID=6565 RepID=A0A8B8CLN1_CRAVI|nr:putative sodium-coupled neutral amino acid transporter 10 isoform X2 [Crassostrea virginica]
MGAEDSWPHVLNLGNSIIGVTVLAMPFCFQQCGVILGAFVLFFCTWLTLVSCKLLITAGISSRKRSYGFLAQYTHGAPGKLAVELGMIGLQIGTLIAQVVIIGDLGPAIISKWTGLPNSNNLRTALIVLACTCIGLPLGLLRNLNTVSRASTFCICFYSVFVLYVIGLAIPNLKAGNWFNKVNLWRVDGLFKCLPIFSFAFGCQTQLFILYDALPEPSLKEISSIVSSAVNMCTVAYLLVGFFGYVAFCDTTIGGDVITQFSETFVVEIIQILFVLSIVVTFPLIIFPCRGSFYTLLFAQKPKHEDIESRPIIPEIHFKVITVSIVLFAMVVGILVPNVEFVLAMNGATMGTLICYIFPAMFFLRVMTPSSERKSVAQFVFITGVTIMVLCTYTTLNSQDHVQPKPIIVEKVTAAQRVENKPVEAFKKEDFVLDKKHIGIGKDKRIEPPDKDSKIKSPPENDKRQEPPIPHAPDNAPVEVNGSLKESLKESKDIKKTTTKIEKEKTNRKTKEKNKAKVEKQKDPPEERVKQEESKEGKTGDGEAIVEGEGKDTEEKQQDLLDELKKQQIEHKKLIQEQREILKELKEHKREAHKEGDNIKTRSPAKGGDNAGQQQQQQQLQNTPAQNQQQEVNQVQNQPLPQGQQQQNLPVQGQLNQQVMGQQQLQQNQQQLQGQQQNVQFQGQVNQPQVQQLPLQGQQQQNRPNQGQVNQGNFQQPQQDNLPGQGHLIQSQEGNVQGQSQFNKQVNMQGQGQVNQNLNKIQQNAKVSGDQQQMGQNQIVEPLQLQQQNVQQGQAVNQQQMAESAHAQVQQQQQQAQKTQLSNQQANNDLNNLNIPDQQKVIKQTATVNSGPLKNPQNEDGGSLHVQDAQVVDSAKDKQAGENAPNAAPSKGMKPKTPHSDI